MAASARRLRPPPNPETRNPGTAATVLGADLKAAVQAVSRQGVNYASAEAVSTHFPAAARVLSVYDGRTRMGTVVALEGTRRAFGFDVEGHPIGEFVGRKVAMNAVGARFKFERGRARAS